MEIKTEAIIAILVTASIPDLILEHGGNRDAIGQHFLLTNSRNSNEPSLEHTTQTFSQGKKKI